MNPTPFTYLSICSGIEAASVAWEPLGWVPCGFAEIEKFPSTVLAHHWPEVPNLGDMTQYHEWPDTLRPHLIVGGTPCQAFSVAGLRKGLADPRGNLTLTFLAILARYRAEWVVWENVPGVLSDQTGAFGAFLGGLGELGYGTAYRVLDAQYFGVAQRRRRVFVVGHLGDWRRAAAVLFERESLRGDPAPCREAGQSVAGTFKACAGSGGWSNSADHAAAGYMIPEIANPLTAKMHKGINTTCDEGQTMIASAFGGDIARTLSARHDSSPCADRGMDVVAFYPTNRQPEFGNYQNISPAVKVGSSGSSGNPPAVAFQSNAGSQGGDVFEELSPTLRVQKTGGGGMPAVAFAQNTRDELREMQVVGALAAEPGMKQTSYIRQQMQVRRLTPRECERLQGFPDDHTLVPWRGKTAPDGPRYKALGNSMAVPVMRWIGQRIADLNRDHPINQEPTTNNKTK
jgi:DNA (cytosine-5)-methyltransferase 1